MHGGSGLACGSQVPQWQVVVRQVGTVTNGVCVCINRYELRGDSRLTGSGQAQHKVWEGVGLTVAA